jgi:hypothetical protein
MDWLKSSLNGFVDVCRRSLDLIICRCLRIGVPFWKTTVFDEGGFEYCNNYILEETGFVEKALAELSGLYREGMKCLRCGCTSQTDG